MGHVSANSPDGNVDAVRVMLLGVNESGRPSVGIDLGYACTQPHGSNIGNSSHNHSRNESSSNHNSYDGSHRHSREGFNFSRETTLSGIASSFGDFQGFGGFGASGQQSTSFTGSGFSGGAALTGFTGNTSLTNNSLTGSDSGDITSMEGSPASVSTLSRLQGDAPGVSSIDLGRVSPSLSLSPGSTTSVLSRASTTRASRPASPFVFQRPQTPGKTPSLPNARKSFVFSEWASRNRQTFVFEGSHSVDGIIGRHQQPCKFVPTKALTLALQVCSFRR